MIAASYMIGPEPPREVPPLIRRLIGAEQQFAIGKRREEKRTRWDV